MNARKALLTIASSLALTAAGVAVPTAAHASASGCSAWKSSTIAVTAYCKTVSSPSSYRAWTECVKGGSNPQFAIAVGPWRNVIDHTNSVAKCGAGFVVGSDWGWDILKP